MKIALYGLVMIVAVGSAAWSSETYAGENQPNAVQSSANVQSGLLVFRAYSVYFSEYKQTHAAGSCRPLDPTCNPCGISFGKPTTGQIACQILNPTSQPGAPLSPGDPIPLSLSDVIIPGSAASLPSDLSDVLQAEFQTLINRVPANHSKQLHGWTLALRACSKANSILWSGYQPNAGSTGGTICLSPLIVRAVFIDLVSDRAAHLFKLLLSRDSPDPFAFNGNSAALIQAFAAKEKINMTDDDVRALAGAIDGEISDLGVAVLPALRESLDYLMAREIATTYQSIADESAIAREAASLVNPNAPHHVDLAPVNTVLLPDALAAQNASNWGVSAIGDGQQVLAGMKSLP